MHRLQRRVTNLVTDALFALRAAAHWLAHAPGTPRLLRRPLYRTHFLLMKTTLMRAPYMSRDVSNQELLVTLRKYG